MRVVDTSVWIEWIIGSPLGETLARELPGNERWIVPTIVQYELSRWLARELSDAAAARAIAFSKELVVAPLTTDIATKAAAYGERHGLAAADAIIFATARDARADLLTCDEHFAELPGVTYFKKSLA
jgi:predicted nucleic acid-binding protein